MFSLLKGAVGDADVVVVVTDIFAEAIADEISFQRLQVTDRPVIVVINKIDLLNISTCQHIPSKSKKRYNLFKKKIARKRKNMWGEKLKAKPDLESGKLDKDTRSDDSIPMNSLVSEYMKHLSMDVSTEKSAMFSNTSPEFEKHQREYHNIDDIISIWQSRLPKAEIITLSTLKQCTGISTLLERLVHYLPEGPKYFPDDEVSTNICSNCLNLYMTNAIFGLLDFLLLVISFVLPTLYDYDPFLSIS